jgi:hypothetical protein
MGQIQLGKSGVNGLFERRPVGAPEDRRVHPPARALDVGVWSRGEQICAQFALALADDMGTAKAFSERGDLPAEAESRGGDKPPLAVHAWLKEL